MRRVAELGWLPKIDLISTVSGGSIIGAFLALRWPDLLEAGADGNAFEKVICRPFLDVVQNHNFLRQWLLGSWRWPFKKLRNTRFTRTDDAAALLDRWFFGGAYCTSLPESPVLVLNATSLQSIRSWRFTKGGLGDSRIGYAPWNDKPLTLGTCVGCSAAFPPVFPPVRIERKNYDFSGSVYGETKVPDYPLIPLNDGGVYDNSGLEALIKSISLPGLDFQIEPADFLIVSDGGAPAKYRFNSAGLPGIGDALLLYRVDEIAREQVSALRTRWLLSQMVSGERSGVFVSLKSEVARIGKEPLRQYCARVQQNCLMPADLLSKIRGIRTSLDRFNPAEVMALMYHAYMMTDAFLWHYRDSYPSAYQLERAAPPGWLIEFTPTIVAEWNESLRRSASVLCWR